MSHSYFNEPRANQPQPQPGDKMCVPHQNLPQPNAVRIAQVAVITIMPQGLGNIKKSPDIQKALIRVPYDAFGQVIPTQLPFRCSVSNSFEKEFSSTLVMNAI